MTIFDYIMVAFYLDFIAFFFDGLPVPGDIPKGLFHIFMPGFYNRIN